MGRLFWKFFFAFWLALSVVVLCVGMAIWLKQRTEMPPVIDLHATAFVLLAKQIHKEHGDHEFIAFLEGIAQAPGPEIYVINKSGEDILGRETHPKIVNIVEQVLSSYTGHAPVAELVFANGESYYVYSPQHIGWKKSLPNLLADFAQKNPHFAQTISALPMELAPFQPGVTPTPILPFTGLPLLTLFLIGSVSSFIFSWLLAWYFTSPINRLRSAFSQVASGHLETRINPKPTQFTDELTDLGNYFDNMAKQIQGLVVSQQRLLHDVSHEVRSPLARMQAAIGIAMQQPEKIGSILNRLEKDTQRISDLIGELLLLAKLESGVNEDGFQDTDLYEFIEDIVNDARFEATNKKIHIYLNSEHNIHLYADPTLLQRAVENIIRNAIKYSEPFTAVYIEVTLNSYEKKLEIHIKDQGPGLPEKALNMIFQPFYRAQSEQSDGTGLGLAIASRAVQVHGGEIKARNRSGGGLCVTISLPYNRVSHIENEAPQQ